MDLDRFRALPLLGIARGITSDDVGPLTEAVIEAGLTSLEITMNTPGAAALIGRMRAAAGDRLMIGAGTVLDVETHAAAGRGGRRALRRRSRAGVSRRPHAAGDPQRVGRRGDDGEGLSGWRLRPDVPARDQGAVRRRRADGG